MKKGLRDKNMYLRSVKLPVEMDTFLSLFTVRTAGIIERFSFQLWCDAVSEKKRTRLTGRIANHTLKTPYLNTSQERSQGSYSLVKKGRPYIDLHLIIGDLKMFLSSTGYSSIRMVLKSCLLQVNDVKYYFTQKSSQDATGAHQSFMVLWKIAEDGIGIMEQDQIDYLLAGPLNFCAPSHCSREWRRVDVCY